MGKRPLDDFSHRLSWADLDPSWIERLIEMASFEDLKGGGLANIPSVTGDATTQTVILPGGGGGQS
ncbi:hypothetical protein [Cerasicoccus arenae]|uniref:Uncharacterized protein n=1 Tax=Cerasicoccus arenae TaxID=424488 RepID=A0A8J3GEC8_9BACT|nr:hypothetical protein [Cerasicoccus arenae]GHC02425.1 hypothetical protein GCM10007047_18730 [Cerasicoccus arenae]